MEGKLSIGLLSSSSISFNDNAIVRDFYPKKFYFFYFNSKLRTTLDLLSSISSVLITYTEPIN